MQKLAQIKRSFGGGEFATTEKSSLKNVGGRVTGTLLARYYKGADGDGDTVILVYGKKTSTT